ncbi:hypothetical protein [Streptomyces sp. YGL11-2]|uniref:hypothetical protein n=1 Tax=Streptomyces sp. YGL11-2 TaxID=3414028 RepID=UPI003CE9AC7B
MKDVAVEVLHGCVASGNTWRDPLRRLDDEAELRRSARGFIAPRAELHPTPAWRAQPENGDFDASFPHGPHIILYGDETQLDRRPSPFPTAHRPGLRNRRVRTAR